MPPKPKFTKEEIVQTALEVVSQKGAAALTAQELANALGSSARPIFTVFRTMQEVQDAVREAAMRRFETFAAQKLLYQLLFMQENRSVASFDDVFGALGPTAQTCIELLQAQYDLSQPDARRLFENVWIYTFGVGALCATRVCRFCEEALGQMLTTEFQAMLRFVQAQNGKTEE